MEEYFRALLLFEKYAEPVWRRVRVYYYGKDVLIIGPSGAGKSTFYDFLDSGVLAEFQDHVVTPKYRAATFIEATFASGDMGQNAQKSKAKFDIRKLCDSPGQTGPNDHAIEIGKRCPHGLIIVFDCQKGSAKISDYLEKLGGALEAIMNREKRIQDRLQVILVLLNKRDRLDTEAEFKTLQNETKTAITRYLEALPRGGNRSVAVLPCVSVNSSYKDKLIKNVIHALWKGFRQ